MQARLRCKFGRITFKFRPNETLAAHRVGSLSLTLSFSLSLTLSLSRSLSLCAIEDATYMALTAAASEPVCDMRAYV